MLDDNPYTPSNPSPLVDNTATRGQRLAAAVIDFVLMMFALSVCIKLFGLGISETTDIQVAMKELEEQLNNLSDRDKAFLFFTPYVCFLLLHGFLLQQSGQTIGKRIMGIAIVRLDNQKPVFTQLIMQRYMTQWLAGLVPVIGILLRLADVLAIYRDDKRCVHDIVAGTKVIDMRKAQPNPNTFVV